MSALLWSRGPTVFDAFYGGRVVRFIAWVCPRCDRRNRTVVHRGPITGGPNGSPMTRDEIANEYGTGAATLTWSLGLVPGEADEPTWSFGPTPGEYGPGGFVPVPCGVCGQRAVLSSHATKPLVGILERLRADPRRGDPVIAFHDPLGSAWSAEFPEPTGEVYL